MKDNKLTTIFQVSNGLSNGGAERMVYDLCKGLSSKGKYKVYLILTDRDDPQNTIKDLFNRENIDFKIFDISNEKRNPLKTNLDINRLIKKYKPDIIHTHQITLAYCIIGYLLSWRSIKVHTVHNDSHREFNSKLFRVLYHILFVVFNIKLVSISSYIKTTSIDEYFLLKESNHFMIYNGRTMEMSLTEGKYQSTEDFNIIMVGRLTNVKNHAAAIKAMDLIINRRKINSIKLHIYGAGPEKNNLESLINDYNLSNNVFLKGITSNINSKLIESDLFLMTSLHEGFPISVVEALFVGLPLILSKFGSALELVEGNGFLVSYEDIEEISQSIEEIYFDVDLREKMMRKSKELSSMYTLENMITNYENLYKKLLRIDENLCKHLKSKKSDNEVAVSQ